MTEIQNNNWIEQKDINIKKTLEEIDRVYNKLSKREKISASLDWYKSINEKFKNIVLKINSLDENEELLEKEELLSNDQLTKINSIFLDIYNNYKIIIEKYKEWKLNKSNSFINSLSSLEEMWNKSMLNILDGIKFYDKKKVNNLSETEKLLASNDIWWFANAYKKNWSIWWMVMSIFK